MALSVVDIYRDLLPKTNCGDCGLATCLAFASMVVSEKWALSKCPHLSPEAIAAVQPELDEQYAQKKWTKKDMAADALVWAKERAASMRLEDLPGRIGGRLKEIDGEPALALPYFNGTIHISAAGIYDEQGEALNRWEQVFIYNHMAQGGSADPVDQWVGLEQIPNTVSKMISMRDHVEQPLIEHFGADPPALLAAAAPLGGMDVRDRYDSADVALRFTPLPKLPLILLFWGAEPEDHLEARAKLLFNATVTEHLDIESILFLSERLRQLLCQEEE